ncbi:uncharacterized protein LOC122723105 [Manihot esculenta]|uniref:uncharacterized protein LOC122723105 n=1 Tax=Manihot esculenta TaxID=3983 RepID=UPI001CC37966|nr:uncharacterized protein LOC122723105 [Manihot esculenta]
MDKIKPPKNFTLSQESMNAALDALRAGRSVSEATQEVAQVISSRSAGRSVHQLLPELPSRAPRGIKSSKPSSRSSSSTLPRSSRATGSCQTASARTEVAPKVTDRPAEGFELVRADAALSFGDAPEESLEASSADRRAPEGEVEVIPASESVPGAAVEVASVIEGIPREEGESRSVDDILPPEKVLDVPESAVEKAASKRPLPSDVPAPVPVPKMFQASRRPTPDLPPLEKEKTPVVPLLSAPNNEILNAEDRTSPINLLQTWSRRYFESGCLVGILMLQTLVSWLLPGSWRVLPGSRRCSAPVLESSSVILSGRCS